jgi:DNA-binding PadR family transcriptional regulator
MFRRFSVPMPVLVGLGLEEALGSHCFHHSRHHGRGASGKDFWGEMFDRGWGDEQRTRRGDIKFLLLELLSEQPCHGYELIKQIESRYGGFRRLSPGSVYPTLQMLEDGGYVTSETREGKRVYTITEEGRQLLSDRVQDSSTDSPWDPFRNLTSNRPQELMALRKAAMELAGAVMQVAKSGDSEQISRAQALLEQTKRDIYTILAEK